MRVWRFAVEEMGWTLLRSGEYGKPPSWKPWLAQVRWRGGGEEVGRRWRGDGEEVV